ncbi:hypothetical protein EMCRGX_G001122 [Ephydatia muelleri]
MFLDPECISADSWHLFTDASGSHGFGAFFDGSWCRGSWLPHQMLPHHSIQWQELFAILAAAGTWHHKLEGCRVIFHCDNLAVVHAWSGQSSRDPALMVLLRELFFVAAQSNFTIQLVHVPGKYNVQADALSRDLMTKFFVLAPQANPLPSVPIPASKHQVAAFATNLWPTVTLQTIHVYLAGVSFLHHVEVSGAQILAQLLKSARDSRSLQQQDRQMIQAVMSLAFFGFLRVGEFTATLLHPTPLSRGDIQLVEHVLQIRFQPEVCNYFIVASTGNQVFSFSHLKPLVSNGVSTINIQLATNNIFNLKIVATNSYGNSTTYATISSFDVVNVTIEISPTTGLCEVMCAYNSGSNAQGCLVFLKHEATGELYCISLYFNNTFMAVMKETLECRSSLLQSGMYYVNASDIEKNGSISETLAITNMMRTCNPQHPASDETNIAGAAAAVTILILVVVSISMCLYVRHKKSRKLLDIQWCIELAVEYLQNECTQLMEASKSGNIQQLTALLEKGAKVNHQDKTTGYKINPTKKFESGSDRWQIAVEQTVEYLHAVRNYCGVDPTADSSGMSTTANET